jgi:glutaminase
VAIETRPADPVAAIASPIAARLREIYERARPLAGGELASYIPQLARANPEWFGVCVVTVDGHVYEFGDATQPFTIQSVSKPFTYAAVLEDLGVEATLARVGVEPSGDAFNSIVVDEGSQRPFNPMVNAGAIVTTGLVTGDTAQAREDRLRDMFGVYLGERPAMDERAYRSEIATSDRNRAIAYLMSNLGVLEEPEAALDLYVRQCSLVVDTRGLATMAATLANGGVNPVTGARAASESTVARVLSVMSVCGMYDYAGEWVYRVGLPAKSGVSGGIIAVLPGQFGVGVFSPRLDPRGNSVRGREVCEELSRSLGLHQFEAHVSAVAAVRQTYTGDIVTSKRERAPEQREILDRIGASIRVFELQGDVYFSSVESITRAVLEVVGDAEFVILDGKRLGYGDAPGTELLEALRRELEDSGRRVLFAHLPQGAPMRAALELLGAPAKRFLPDVDLALEWCEDELLARHAPQPSAVAGNLEDHPLFAGLTAEDGALLLVAAQREEFGPGEVVFHEGDVADRMYFVLEGEVSVRLRFAADQEPKRLTSVGPGAAFGEVALLDGGLRSTEVRAECPTVCWSISRATIAAMLADHPRVAAILYRNLATTLSGRLRRANDEIRALAR